MLIANRAQGIPADADAAGEEDQADDECRERLDAAVSVRVIRIRRLDRHDHAQKHDRRCQHVAGKLHAGREDR